jgi:hypothetical protein
MKTLIFSIILSFVFISCQDKSDTHTESNREVDLNINSNAPKIDQSTPDLAVKSFMKYNKWSNIISFKIAEEYLKQNQKDIDKFYAAEYPDSLKSGIKYIKVAIEKVEKNNRSISDIKIMTDTRAVVTQQTDEKTSGFDGEKTTVYERFTLSKDDDRWLIERCEKTCFACDGTGKRKDYEYYFKEVYRECEYCGGTGWRVIDAMEFN